mmetsp:Transcript_60166/g.105403  ORF Transcript_60166/g.105403 Transcript_60166/m.105403 type:complete len:319 (-) Transcript_60166:87-1043(-)
MNPMNPPPMMNPVTPASMTPVPPTNPPDPRNLWFGAPGGDDKGRSPDEVRIIHEMAMEDVEAFLRVNHVDRGAADQLRKEPPHILLAVLEHGPLRSCRDPSGVIVARIRAARNGTLAHQFRPLPPPTPVDPNASNVDQFIAANRIDHAAGMALKNEPPHIQAAVMAKGSLTYSTNPSASLMARIRVAKEPGGLQQGPPKLPQAVTPGLLTPAAPPIADLSAEALKAAQKLTEKQNAQQAQLNQPPPLALEDNRSSTPLAIGDLNAEAAKAAQKLNQASTGRERSRSRDQGQADIKNVDDKRLQDEAMRAMQALNYDDI